MKIEVYVICYNEELLLPYFLRHYREFCDRIIVFDNYSTDRSQEICRQDPRVEVIKYDSSDQVRDDIYLQIKNNCWKESLADWVIIGDMDEFVYHPDIKRILGESKATIITPEWFNMYSEKFPITQGQIYEEVVLGIPGGPKTNIFRPSEIEEINYDPGCHIAHPRGNVIPDKSSGLKTLHMRNLSKEFVISRNAVCSKRMSELNRSMGWGYHYDWPAQEVSRRFDEEILKTKKVI
jgi:glycosyltransferase involved in cell wall biosynthesis